MGFRERLGAKRGRRWPTDSAVSAGLVVGISDDRFFVDLESFLLIGLFKHSCCVSIMSLSMAKRLFSREKTRPTVCHAFAFWLSMLSIGTALFVSFIRFFGFFFVNFVILSVCPIISRYYVYPSKVRGQNGIIGAGKLHRSLRDA